MEWSWHFGRSSWHFGRKIDTFLNKNSGFRSPLYTDS